MSYILSPDVILLLSACCLRTFADCGLRGRSIVTNNSQLIPYFTHPSLAKAYHEIPVSHLPKIPFELFELTRMTFGLWNAAQIFQRVIYFILRNFSSESQHLDPLEYGLVLNVEIIILWALVKFLGHMRRLKRSKMFLC